MPYQDTPPQVPLGGLPGSAVPVPGATTPPPGLYTPQPATPGYPPGPMPYQEVPHQKPHDRRSATAEVREEPFAKEAEFHGRNGVRSHLASEHGNGL